MRNPIIPGSYPDPSVCRVGDDYWLVNSSFEFFPALPVHHSRDLVHWRCVGNVVDRPECLDLSGVRRWSGVWAPTIRHHDGVFYVVWTDMRGVGGKDLPRPYTYAARAKDPAGAWSDPVLLDDPHGFDPSLFFEDDGTAWYGATYCGGHGREGQYLREFDTGRLALVGDEHVIWTGRGEGTHIYRTGGSYYLLAAAGGTGQNHCVVVARSDTLLGPYTECPRNPILTHRHFGLQHPINATGHGDLVQAQDGSWWMVLLAKQEHGKGHDVCGRETFLVPVGWEGGWPLVNPGRGVVDPEVSGPPSLWHPWPDTPAREDFDAAPGPEWCYLRTPDVTLYDMKSRRGFLRLQCGMATLADIASPAFRCHRLLGRQYGIRTAVEFLPAAANERAGLALYASELSHFQLVIARTDGGLRAQVWQRDRRDVVEAVVGEVAVTGSRFVLSAETRGDELDFGVSPDGAGEPKVVAVCDARLLSDERSWTSNGAWYGCYATSCGVRSTSCADFDWVEYR